MKYVIKSDNFLLPKEQRFYLKYIQNPHHYLQYKLKKNKLTQAPQRRQKDFWGSLLKTKYVFNTSILNNGLLAVSY